MLDNFFPGEKDHQFFETEILDHPECKPMIDYLNTKLKPSFWEMGYDQDYNENKLIILPPEDRDTHPMPIDSMKYLSKVFDYEFSPDTIKGVEEWESKLWNIMINRPSDSGIVLQEYIETKFPEFSQPF